jgi:C-terminal processing protease CtpA/Prc
MLRAADLQTDVAVLRRAYEQLHPGLYRYSSKAQMDADFEELRAALNHDQSLEQAYVAFSIFAAKVKCGHTYANFFNQPKAVAEQLFTSQTRVPFYFVWINRQMVVTEDFTPEHALPRGTRIVAINGVETGKILARLMTIARADGSNDAKRVASLAVSGDSVYETFDIFYPMFFPSSSTTMKLLVQRPEKSKLRTVSVEALTYEQRIAPIKLREQGRKGGDDVLFEWKYLADGSAYLRMPTWALYDSKWEWKKWLEGHLDEAVERKAPGLILDLRGNEGGQDVGNVILSRLVTANLELSNLRRLVRYRKVADDLAPYLDTWDPSFKDWGEAAVEMAQPWPTAPPVHYFLLKKYDDDAVGDKIVAEGKHYGGRVFVLVDANNSSATFQFAQIVQQHKLGTLVGEPTGGSQRGINGGAFFFLRLPQSKIEMDLPLIGTFPRTEMPDAGLTPDVTVQATARDIADGRDAVLAAVAEKIKRGN